MCRVELFDKTRLFARRTTRTPDTEASGLAKTLYPTLFVGIVPEKDAGQEIVPTSIVEIVL